jgi:hypothetical protein
MSEYSANRDPNIKSSSNKRRDNLATLYVALLSASAPTNAQPALPFFNPHWAQSAYPISHSTADFTPLAGPVGPSRRLSADEITWKTVGPINGFTPVYSGAYPNGKRVIWVGGYDRVAKLDADTLEVLTTYALGGNTYYGDEEIRRYMRVMDGLDDETAADFSMKLMKGPFASNISAYRVLSRDNELFLPHRAPDGSTSLQVFGEQNPSDPGSAIELRREWRIPSEVSSANITGVNMTASGEIVIVTMDGVIIAVAPDFSGYYSLKLSSMRTEAPNQDFFSAFVRNGIVTDDHDGIYVVTRDHMHRVQWTGHDLSLRESEGAWSAPYPNELTNGSGTTPGLMGWGPNEDHLVAITDGSRNNNMVVFWRDDIPEDWKGLPGYDRRVAGITPIHFGVSDDEKVRIENAPVIFGYGAFFNNTYPVQRLPDQGSLTKQYIMEAFYMAVPGHEARGGSMIRWDPRARELKTTWKTQENLVATVCMVSGATNLLYCWGARNRDWTLEAFDWNNGKSAFHYTLGRSRRFTPLGGLVIVAPHGAIVCGCTGGLGIVRVDPQTRSVRGVKSDRPAGK